MKGLKKLLRGHDLRFIGKNEKVISTVKNQKDFDHLFKFLFHPSRIVVMHTADAIEKITIDHPQYLFKHKKELKKLFVIAKNKELKWHLALMMPRIVLRNKEWLGVWTSLKHWACDITNSRLVRVAAVQGLFEMAKHKQNYFHDLDLLLSQLEKEQIPSINARIRNIRKDIAHNRTVTE